MSFRTVVISKQSKLSYKNRYLVVKQELDEKYIHMSEIDTLIVDSISVSISTYLMKELSDNKINVIFCDEKHNPFAELKPFYLSHNTSKKILQQCSWNKSTKDLVWKEIVMNKIENQYLLLKHNGLDGYELLKKYISETKLGDKTNREGHAAKVYFNSLFGKSFTRNNDSSINAALNYGYAILLSTFNKEIISNGYITQLGINHKNEFNEFNLSCDLMEPFRVIIDNFVYHNIPVNLDSEYKMNLVNLFNNIFKYRNKKYTLKDIISMYVKDVFKTIENGDEYNKFLIYEK